MVAHLTGTYSIPARGDDAVTGHGLDEFAAQE